MGPEFHQSESDKIKDGCGVSHKYWWHDKESQNQGIVNVIHFRIHQANSVSRENIQVQKRIDDGGDNAINNGKVDKSWSDSDDASAGHPMFDSNLIFGCQAHKPVKCRLIRTHGV